MLDNNGTVSINNIDVTDTLPDGTTGALVGPTGDDNSDLILDVNETWTYTIDYTVTQSDINTGIALVNQA